MTDRRQPRPGRSGSSIAARPAAADAQVTSAQQEVMALRRQLRESNRQHDFEKSRAISKQIHGLLYANIDDAISSVITALGNKIQQQLREYNMIVSQLDEEFRQRENYLRDAIDGSFAELNDRHLQLLTELEMFRESERIRSTKRSTSNVSSLEQISVYLADREEFDQAIAISKEAKATQETEVSDRIRALELRVQNVQRRLLAQFEKEFRLLEDRLAKGIQSVRDQLDGEIKIQQRQCSVAVQRLMSSAIHEAIAKVGKKDREQEIAAKITGFTRTKASQLGMNRKLTFDD